MAVAMGFCENCHRLRLLARIRIWAPLPTGTCVHCETER